MLGAVLLAAAGCHTESGPAVYIGEGAAADGKAAQVGRTVLENGGDAADAAVAMALTMAVTLPSRVGLGGGGVCLVHDPKTKAVRTLDFLPESTRPGQAPLPGLVRGLYALSAGYGRKPWEGALGGAESLAAVGTPVSQTLAADLRAGAARLAGDPAARRVFFAADGRPLALGERLTQPELAATLGALRNRGLGAFYGDRLVGAPALWRDTLQVENDNDVIHFPDRGDGGGAGLVRAWQAAAAAGADGAWLGALLGALGPAGATAATPTAVVTVIDPYEQAVACVLTQGGLFGNGRMDGDTGVLAAGPAGAGGIGGPVLVVNPHQWTTLFAGGGAVGGADEGNRSAEAALLSVLHASVVERIPGPAILLRPRAAPAADGGALVEAGIAPAPLGALAAGARPVAALGRVEAAACLYDRKTGFKSCEAATDPRGSGLNFFTTPR
jgi:gamma-glutamyltranspeptidase/glutathione hydrolase